MLPGNLINLNDNKQMLLALNKHVAERSDEIVTLINENFVE